MKKFSLRHNRSTIELVGPFKHLKIFIDYGRVNHNAVCSEAYWFMRFLNKQWNFTLDSAKSQVLPAKNRSCDSTQKARIPESEAIADPAPSNDVLDPDVYQKLLERLERDLRDRLPQPSTKLRHSSRVRKELGISQTTLWRWAKQGLLKTVKIHNSVYVDLESLSTLEKRARTGELAADPHGAAAAVNTRQPREQS